MPAGELRPDFVSDAMVDELVLAGSPQRCRERLAARVEAGLTSAVFFHGGAVRSSPRTWKSCIGTSFATFI